MTTVGGDGGVAMAKRVRSIAVARWFGVVFAFLQVTIYATLPYPDGIQAIAYGLATCLLVANVVILALMRGNPSRERVRRVAVGSLVIDVLVANLIVIVYAFDPISALFALLFILPMEGALLFGFRGSLAAWGATAVLYLGREFYGDSLGNPFELDSYVFRMGLVGLAALIVGFIARDLATERRAAEEARDRAHHADAWRRRLVAMLAHDLRSPLGTVRMSLNTLSDAEADLLPERRTQLLGVATRQVNHLLALTSDLLDLASAEEGRLLLYRQHARVTDLVRTSRDLVAGQTGGMILDIPADLTVWVDPARVRQVLTNLLSNAVKHGKPPIQISARDEGDGFATIVVRDHGPGVPADRREGLFTPFGPGPEGGDSVGLGTWVIGELTRAHGGRVSYEPADPGARFIVRLPTRADDQGAGGDATAG
jgi:signal transduction histidine kinase